MYQVDCYNENSQYILILFFQGYNHSNAYIAAQGPMPHTISDFWWMIWENKLVTVVMLTKCTEAGNVLHSKMGVPHTKLLAVK